MATLNTPLTIQEVKYSDFVADFAPHPVTKDIGVVTNDESIKQSLRQLFNFKPFERLFQSEIRSPLYDYLFEVISPITANLIHDAIVELATKHEPRISILRVDVDPTYDEHGYKIKMFYKSFESTQTKNFSFFLERVN